MPLTQQFLDAVKPLDKNWSMGVELVSPYLYSLIRLTRPQRVLEVGAGYSSAFILQALADNREEDRRHRELMRGQVRLDQHVGLTRLTHGTGLLRRHPLPLALPEYYDSEHNPKLAIIDNDSHPASTASLVQQIAGTLGLSDLLEFHGGDFRGLSKKFHGQPPFDLVWFDCGSLDEYTDFLEEYWGLINPDGGFLVLHSTLTNLQIRYVVQGLKLKQATEQFNRFELLSLLEPHKWRQNSLTMIRMLSPRTEKLYSVGP
jgi:predicted O-methyltransferase YrrM